MRISLQALRSSPNLLPSINTLYLVKMNNNFTSPITITANFYQDDLSGTIPERWLPLVTALNHDVIFSGMDRKTIA